ncbi:hypothetical protein AiwAL_06225 [Acidiphilium sp. AL]|uniref:Uncharacterized protein n=1 Tax=Acidiphilium iwatense TaxID=768198 RepID=A0ABS9DX16_9PROT|nr:MULTISPECIES: hypothetical protein [Acidiphilium]MCF3947286.1 hypothetical protein [Acidiphilium iwatense]MCU4159700.1 hypothetical protein [Acidiphilium sp. AL]
MRARLHRHDWAGIGVVLAVGVAAILFREVTIVPRAYVGVCAGPQAPLVCVPRQAVLWLQYERLFGLASLVLGLLGFAFARRWPGVAALAVGVAAVVNYNGTEGIIGAALGLWGWLEAAAPRYAGATNGGQNARQ